MTKEAQGLAGHTPTPWHTSKLINHTIYAGTPSIKIAMVHDVPTPNAMQAGTNTTARANAALIVEAVNSYATLTAEQAKLAAEIARLRAKLKRLAEPGPNDTKWDMAIFARDTLSPKQEDSKS